MRVWSEGQHESSAFAYSEESRWSRRCYICNFCEREFKSAQALGGHMNVHRRDRALLRLSSDSNSTSTFLPAGNTPPLIVIPKPCNSLLGEGIKCLPQETHWTLPISPNNRNTAPYPFFHFFDTSSSNSGSHDHTQYSNKEDICRFRSDALYSIPFELSIEQSPSPSVVRSRDGAALEIKMDCRAVCGRNVHNNIGLDLELRLGYTSSSRPSL